MPIFGRHEGSWRAAASNIVEDVIAWLEANRSALTEHITEPTRRLSSCLLVFVAVSRLRLINHLSIEAIKPIDVRVALK